MHRPRLLGWHDANVYHVISRTAGREFLFGPKEREMFARLLDKTARFCGIEILTWCCLSNHFHLLIRISESDSEMLRDKLRTDTQAFFSHLRILYKKSEVQELASELDQLRASGESKTVYKSVDRYLKRIGDLSVFVKELKQRFSIWFNSQHQREGALWSARFRSVLVESSPRALRTVASYIDLNPVRAGIVADPKDYRWCGYGQAMGGNNTARIGIRAILREGTCQSGCAGDRISTPPTWKARAGEYRVLLFSHAIQLDDGAGTILRKGASESEVARALDKEGNLSKATSLRLRIRHFTKGTALGSKSFLQALIEYRPQQVSAKRKTGARPIGNLGVGDLYSLRDLKSPGPQ